jgi:AraC-like DNA-binding protein
MNDDRNTENVLTTFSMEDILASPRGEVKEYTTSVPDRKGSLKMVITDTMGIIDGTMVTEKVTAPLTHYNDKPLVEMNFMLEGCISQTYEGLLTKHLYQKGYSNILFNPYAMESNELMHCGTHRIFSAHIEPAYMASLFSGYLPELMPYAEKIAKGEPFVLHAPARGLNNRFRYFFDTFWDCPRSSSLHKIYFDSRILDLFWQQCELLMGHEDKLTGIPKADLEKTHYAREILLANLNDPPSLAGLSRLCSLNEFKLKKYFKQVFDNSVFGLLRDERLDAAKRMIFDGEKNISMIAYELGYAHPQHFQRAFKKRFGITPSGLLK